MMSRFDIEKIRDYVNTTLFYMSLIGFGTIVGIIVVKELRETLFMNNLARLGISYCDLTFASRDSFNDIRDMFFSIIWYILFLKLALLVCYSILKGEQKRILYFEYVLSLIIGIISTIFGSLVYGCLD